MSETLGRIAFGPASGLKPYQIEQAAAKERIKRGRLMVCRLCRVPGGTLRRQGDQYQHAECAENRKARFVGGTA